jgi:Protein of unknown function (DUF1398)
MFTIEELNELHARLGSARTFPSMCGRLRDSASNSMIPTWRAAIRNTSGRAATRSSPHRCTRCFPSLKPVNGRRSFSLRRHELRETTYLEMSIGLARSGIEKWTVHTDRMTITFYDKAGTEMLVEQMI